MTYLFIIHENAKTDSFWRTYLDILPRNFSTPLWWSPDELEILKGTNIYGKYIEMMMMLVMMMMIIDDDDDC